MLNPILAAQKVVDGSFWMPTQASTVAADVDWFARCKDRGLAIGNDPELVLLKRIHGTNLSLDARRNTVELLRAMRSSIRRQRIDASGAAS